MFMAMPKYNEALNSVIEEYERLSEQRAAIDIRLAQLMQAIGSLSQLCNMKPAVEFGLGLTDACRIVLKAVDHPLVAAEIRRKLEAMGYDTSHFSNPLGSIHVVLRRLCRAGEATVAGKNAFAWNRPPQMGVLTKGAGISKVRL
jgi:hypothetical protein